MDSTERVAGFTTLYICTPVHTHTVKPMSPLGQTWLLYRGNHSVYMQLAEWKKKDLDYNGCYSVADHLT